VEGLSAMRWERSAERAHQQGRKPRRQETAESGQSGMETAEPMGAGVAAECLVGALPDLEHSHAGTPGVAGQVEKGGLRRRPDGVIGELGQRIHDGGERVRIG
jgi:hypothetical protein